jgi:hypothetical protein
VCCTEYTISVLYKLYSECAVQSILSVCCTENTESVLYRVYSECVVLGIK